MGRAFPASHVGLDKVDLALPGEFVVPLEEDVGVWVLFYGPEFDFHVSFLAGAEGAGDEGSAAGSYDGDDDVTGRTGGGFHLLGPVDERLTDGLLVEVVFDGVTLEDFVGHAFEILG